ncbi:MAG: hypothetical protein ABIU06_06390 [Anaerolineales bacterium]
MSINSMANAAVARRPDYPPSKRTPKTAAERASAAGKDPTPENSVSTTLKTLTTYVPTETLTLYVALIAALQPTQNTSTPISLWIAFWFFFIFTPLAIWIAYATKITADGKKLPILPRYWPKWEMLAGTIAYTAWSFGLPNSPFSQFTWYSSAVAGFIVLIASTFLGMIAGLFQRPLRATDEA